MSEVCLANGRILTLAGAAVPRRGKQLGRLGVIDRGYVQIAEDTIVDVGSGEPNAPRGQVIDVDRRVVLPGFVDCHTHACWAGERYGEFESRLAGATYLEILEAGGGIMATVRAVREASEQTLIANTQRRLARMLALGTTTIEIKTGYGLDPDSEMKMLRAIKAVKDRTAMTVCPTFLGAHAIDKNNPHFIEQTINETLPQIVAACPGIVCDAYCEQGAWSLEQTRRLFEQAQALGCPLRVHADQFHSLGMTRLAVQMNALSVDHLEASTPEDLEHLARSRTMGVALPCSGFSVDGRYAPARSLIDAGGAIAVATNYNPGSAPTPSMPFAIYLAVHELKMTYAEAIAATTINGACVLGLQDVLGSLEPGKRADVQVLDTDDERELAFEYATAGAKMVILGGEIAHDRPDAAPPQTADEPGHART